jgi:hypothetical protein
VVEEWETPKTKKRDGGAYKEIILLGDLQDGGEVVVLSSALRNLGGAGSVLVCTRAKQSKKTKKKQKSELETLLAASFRYVLHS